MRLLKRFLSVCPSLALTLLALPIAHGQSSEAPTAFGNLTNGLANQATFDPPGEA